MPELPEVETIAQNLQHSCIIDCKIVAIEVRWKRIFAENADIPIGHKVTTVKRRGKYLIFALSNQQFMIVHLRMSGNFLLKKEPICLKHEHVIIKFDNGYSLHYSDTRKFGRFEICDNPEKHLAHLGLEPLEMSLTNFSKQISSIKKPLKQVLLDQSFIAGLGNIYVDESLWHACLHPIQLACNLSQEQISMLHTAIQNVLTLGLKYGGTSLGHGIGNYHLVNGQSGTHQNHLKIYGKAKMLCQRCNNAVTKMMLYQRGTHFCATCQK